MGDETKDEDIAYRRYAYDRSNSDFEMSNTYARSAAQLSILINGGAATATIAIFAKPAGSEPTGLKSILPWALGSYGVGALLGTVMMIIMTRAIETWALHWMNQGLGKTSRSIERKAERIYWYAQLCFLAAISCFVIGSVLVGLRL